MNEQTEKLIKNDLVAFIRENFVLEGGRNAVDRKIIELACGIYEIFLSYPHPKNRHDTISEG